MTPIQQVLIFTKGIVGLDRTDWTRCMDIHVQYYRLFPYWRLEE